jgi:hypothetical protein
MGNMGILEKIIENEGSCTQWASPSVCKQCPLSKLRKKDDGTYLSCVEALGVQDMTEEEADARYKDVASRILLDETIDNILGEVDGSNK